MLQQYVRLGTLERVLGAALEMQRDDMDRWMKFASRPLAHDTLRKYWQDIDPAVKAEARRLFQQGPRRS